MNEATIATPNTQKIQLIEKVGKIAREANDKAVLWRCSLARAKHAYLQARTHLNELYDNDEIINAEHRTATLLKETNNPYYGMDRLIENARAIRAAEHNLKYKHLAYEKRKRWAALAQKKADIAEEKRQAVNA